MNLIWVIQAYESEDPMGNLSNSCSLELRAKSEEEALKRASDLINKKFYRVAKIIEVNEDAKS